MRKGILKSKILYDYLHDPSALAGSFILVVFILLAILAPWIAPQNPYDLEKVSLSDFLNPPIWMEGGKTPFLLGTDDQGRGILSTILYGCRTSLVVGSGVVLIAGSFGVVMGLLAGYYGGLLDSVTMRMADTFFSFSTTLMAFLLLGLFKQRGVLIVIVAICIADWVRYARTMRGSVLEVKEEAYITAAKATGARDFRLLLKHLLPNAIPPIFVVIAVDLAVVIMLEATLSFLGVGVPLTEPSLGMMIAIGKNYVYAGKWWLVVFPGATLILLVVGINLFADWLREELNPKIERGR
jgi:peptide/nickel transport system permease protein